jgi:hypothetical protein
MNIYCYHPSHLKETLFSEKVDCFPEIILEDEHARSFEIIVFSTLYEKGKGVVFSVEAIYTIILILRLSNGRTLSGTACS